MTSPSRYVVLIVGSNRTGTSLMTEILIEKGFQVPSTELVETVTYPTYESQQFKDLSRRWNQRDAETFVADLPPGKLVLKYPKASFVVRRWLKLLPDARVIYVFRNREEAVQSQLKNWWGDRPFRFLAAWKYRWEWIRGYLAVSNLSVPVCFISFNALKQNRDFQFPPHFGWDELNDEVAPTGADQADSDHG